MGRPTCFQEACWQRKGEKQEWWGVGQDQGRPFVSYDPEVFVNRGRSSGKAGTARCYARSWEQAQQVERRGPGLGEGRWLGELAGGREHGKGRAFPT